MKNNNKIRSKFSYLNGSVVGRVESLAAHLVKGEWRYGCQSDCSRWRGGPPGPDSACSATAQHENVVLQCHQAAYRTPPVHLVHNCRYKSSAVLQPVPRSRGGGVGGASGNGCLAGVDRGAADSRRGPWLNGPLVSMTVLDGGLLGGCVGRGCRVDR